MLAIPFGLPATAYTCWMFFYHFPCALLVRVAKQNMSRQWNDIQTKKYIKQLRITNEAKYAKQNT